MKKNKIKESKIKFYYNVFYNVIKININDKFTLEEMETMIENLQELKDMMIERMKKWVILRYTVL